MQRIAASFRDPASAVCKSGDKILRIISPCYFNDYEKLMGSGLYGKLIAAGMMVAHREVRRSGSELVIEPEKIPFISYPYEWCFSQLKEAALLTLDIQKQALSCGMSLKDATAFNVQFTGGKAIFIDTASFETYRQGTPWVAYNQFCRHFLAPLALMRYVDPGMNKLFLHNLDGIPLALAAKILPLRAKVSPAIFMHVVWQAAFLGQYESGGNAARSPVKQPDVSRTALDGLIDQMESFIRRLDYPIPASTWLDYYDHTNYQDEAEKHKKELVAGWIDRAKPCEIWDLGANTGAYSRLGSDRGIFTVAFDFDASVIERLCRIVRAEKNTRLLPLCMNLLNPSPDVGWDQGERDGMRARGPADFVMALALIHHMAIAGNVPLERVAAFLAHVTGKYLVIEMVPKIDSQVRRMLSSRADIFESYTVENFEAVFKGLFDIVERCPVRGSERILYLMKKNESL